MSDELKFNQEKLFNFLFTKIIQLETELVMQQATLKAIYKHLKPDDANFFELVEPVLKEQSKSVFQERAIVLAADLKSISDDFEGMIQGLINPK